MTNTTRFDRLVALEQTIDRVARALRTIGTDSQTRADMTDLVHLVSQMRSASLVWAQEPSPDLERDLLLDLWYLVAPPQDPGPTQVPECLRTTE